MTLLVIGSTPAQAHAVRSLAPLRSLRVRTNWTARRPDWILVATPGQRAEALRRYQLPAFRVMQVPALASTGDLQEDPLRRGLARMIEVGPYHAGASSTGLAVTRRIVSRLMSSLEQMLADRERDAAERARQEKQLERQRKRAAAPEAKTAV
jgi:hypothetical protein